MVAGYGGETGRINEERKNKRKEELDEKVG